MTIFAPEKKISQPFTRLQTPRVVPNGNGQPRPPTHTQIAERAYDIYIAHDRSDGRSDLDWRQAEEELAHASRGSLPKPEVHYRS